MSTLNLTKIILAGAILMPVTITSIGDANAQKFVTRQHIINGLQIQQPKVRKKRSTQQVIIQRAPRQQQRVVKRRAPAQQKFRAPPAQQKFRAPPARQKFRAPAAHNGQVAVRRAPAPQQQRLRAPQPKAPTVQFRAPPRVAKRRAPPPRQQQLRPPTQQPRVAVRRAPAAKHNVQQFRAPKQNSNIAKSRAPNRNPQHFNSQVANATPNNNERAIRIDQKVADYNNNGASVDLEILFDYNSARINPDSVRQLFALGEALQDISLDGSRILIAGHTDAAGSNFYNNDLSYRRAQSVSDFLINYAGVSADRLAIEGYGEELLKYPDAPNSGQNRRVEIINLGS